MSATEAEMVDGDAPETNEENEGDKSTPPAVRDQTLKELITGIKRRRGAKPMPSTVLRYEEQKKKKKRRLAGLPVEDEVVNVPIQPTSPTPEVEEEAIEDVVVAPQVTLDAEGNIVIDQNSLVVATGGGDGGEGEGGDVIVENNGYENKVTSASWSKRESAHKWEEAETESFYTALRKFGTDFQLMENYFPGRSRRQLKLKFKREEKENGEKIEETLNGPPLPLPVIVRVAEPIVSGEGAVVLDDKEDSDGDGSGDGEKKENSDDSESSKSDSDSE